MRRIRHGRRRTTELTLRIGIDLSCWTNMRGYGRFTRELVREMLVASPEDEMIGFAERATAESIDLAAPNFRVVPVGLRESPLDGAAAQTNRSPADLLRMGRVVHRERPDAMFFPSVYSYFPVPPSVPTVLTVHDVIAERYPKLTTPSWRARTCWRLKVACAIRQARLVLTVSQFAAREISDVLGVPRSRLRVALEAPGATFRPSDSAEDVQRAAHRAGVPAQGRWFVYVGGFGPHKNVRQIIAAHGVVARARSRPPHLLLIGRTHGDPFYSDVASLRDAIEAEGTSTLVHWTGYLDDEIVRHLLTGATALLLPSVCEGFGLPAVEAAMCGTPVIATVASPLPEILAGGGIFVEPGDVAAIVTGMQRLLDDDALRAGMGGQAQARARLLSWSRAAQTTIDVLHETAA